MDKRGLRRLMREREDGLSPEYLAESDLGIFERVISLPEYASARVLFTYYSAGREPDTRRILRRALRDGKTVCLPRVLGNGVMSALRVYDEAMLVPGALGLLEPPDTAEETDRDDIGLIIVPAAAFDKRGYRLGRGGGYYDRFLAASDAFTVGLARDRLLLDEVPTEPHDLGVRCLVTEKRIARFG